MSHEADWVEDVKRWYFASPASAAAATVARDPDATDFALGYEAAHPALTAGHWTDQPATGFDRSTY